MDISILLSYLRSTSNLALSCNGFNRVVRANGFPIRTSKGELCPKNLSFYKYLEYPDIDKWTVNTFHNAIRYNEVDQLLLLLQHSANIEAKDVMERTAIMFASESDKADCLRLLLENGADIEAKDLDGLTPLMFAARWGRIDCVKLLWEHKADINVEDNLGRIALSWAALCSKIICVDFLMQRGSKFSPEARDKYPGYMAAYNKWFC